MRAFALGISVGFLAALTSAGCGNVRVTCDAAFCNGCCGSDGMCQCSGDESCQEGVCRDTTCKGCTKEGVCQTTLTDKACGNLGVACVDCTAMGGTCSPTARGCVGGTCNGCRDGSGACQAGTSNGQCGANGKPCTSCVSGTICSSGGCVMGTGGGAGGGAGGGSAGGGTGGAVGGGAGGGGAGVGGGTAGGVGGGAAGGIGGGAAGGIGGGAAGGIGGGAAGGIGGGAAGGIGGGAAGGIGGGAAGGIGGGTAGGIGGGAAGGIGGGFGGGAPTLPGDSCSTGAVPLQFGGTMTATATGTTTGYGDETSSATCASGTGAPDRVYSFNVTGASVTVTATLTSSAFLPVVSIRGPSTTCTALSEVACAGPAASGTATATANGLGPGTYYVWVDAASGAGAFVLTVTGASVPPSGTCSAPTPLIFVGNAATAAGTTTGTTSNISGGACPPPSGGTAGSGPEIVYSFTQAATGFFGASIDGAATNRPVLYVRSTCSSTTSLACNAATAVGGSTRIAVPSLAAGTYFLVADSWSGSVGGYTLNATQGSIPVTGGESCTSPILVALTGTSVTYTGSTTSSVNNLLPASNSCDKSTSTGARDVVFQFVAPRSGTLTVTAASTSATPWDLNMNVRSGSTCASSTETVCADKDVDPPEVATLSVTVGSTYWVWITGYSETDYGPFLVNFWLP